ncbi:MAG TPA: type II secretion system ATPase GspE [Nitrospinota bacterium]|nr:type II secretion system ATPase GspE [Nitrospinota bacterium]|tara:strand:+ start:173805 stop:175373 length:1569 start_codon:yes stop_codon:yes gene_type:complete
MKNQIGLKKLTDELGLQWLDNVDTNSVDIELAEKISFQFAKSNLILPLRKEEGKLQAVSADPLDTQTLDDLRLLFKSPVEVSVTDPDRMMDLINKVYDMSSQSANKTMDDIGEEEDLDSLLHSLPEDLLETSAEAPVIRLVNSVLVQAVKEKASDIHLEPYERDLVVRYRIDGNLINIISPPKRLQALIVSRIKIMAGLNIAEKRLPQDGRVKIVIAGKEVDIRVSVIPTSHGERVVMRLLDKSNMLIDLGNLGLRGDNLKRLKSLIQLPHGIVLVSGPTGSGKTTTLYSALSSINTVEKNIITVEDPVEYLLPGIGQMPVNTKVGLTFSNGLRSILRQDPDIIMVGEIRDLETAEIAVQASLTGHLVFSTIHTNDAAGSVTRLVDIGVQPFLISSSLVATLAQRLVRVLCPHCREAYDPTERSLAQLGLKPDDIDKGIVFYRAQSCQICRNTGYIGRTGIFELLVVDEEIRPLITDDINSVQIKAAAAKRGFLDLKSSGTKLVIEGATSVEEVVRVTSDAI